MLRPGAATRRAALAVIVGGASACTLVTDLDGLGGGGRTDAAADADAGTPTTDASGPTTWCSSVTPTPRMCLDFDAIDIESLERSVDNGALAFEGAGASAPNALLATVADGKEGWAYVSLPLGDSPTRVAWSFDVRFDQGGLVEFGELRLRYRAGGLCAIQPQLEDEKIQVNEFCNGASGPYQVDHVATQTAGGVGYYHFSIVVDFGLRKLEAQVRRPDGVTGAIDVALDPKVVTGPAELRPGVGWAPALRNGPRILIDNVTIDWQ